MTYFFFSWCIYCFLHSIFKLRIWSMKKDFVLIFKNKLFYIFYNFFLFMFCVYLFIFFNRSTHNKLAATIQEHAKDCKIKTSIAQRDPSRTVSAFMKKMKQKNLQILSLFLICLIKWLHLFYLRMDMCSFGSGQLSQWRRYQENHQSNLEFDSDIYTSSLFQRSLHIAYYQNTFVMKQT